MAVYFGGYDPAKRVDSAAFILLEFYNGILIQRGQKVWDKINYKVQAGDILKIQRKYKMTKLCFDRSGVGDAASELFSREIPMEEIISSLTSKIEMINFMHALFQNGKLKIKDRKLYDQVLEQEKYISDAGNELYRHPSSSHDDIFWALAYACYAAKGMVQGLPKYSMGRTDRKMRIGRSKVDQDILDEFGPGWNVHGY